MAQTEVKVKVKLDLPAGVELLGYERYGDGHGFEVKFPLPDFCRCELCGREEAGHVRVQEDRLRGARPGPVGPAEFSHLPALLPSLLALWTSPGALRAV